MADTEELADYQEDDEYYEEEYVEEGEGQEEVDPEDLQNKLNEMQKELDQVSQGQNEITDESNANAALEENSIYVGQVDYEATPEELQAHFAPCGSIKRITIICDKITGQAKGYAYVEFDDKESIEKALALDESTFKGRQLKVFPKRQNVPKVMRGGGRGRGFGRGGRFGRGGYMGRGGYDMGRGGYGRGGGRGYGYGGRIPGRFGGRGGGRGRNNYYKPY